MEDQAMEKGPAQPNPSPEDDIEFVHAADDTPENRAIVAVVQERLASKAQTLEFDDVVAELGYDPAEFLISD
jgi:hypothetical protein